MSATLITAVLAVLTLAPAGKLKAPASEEAVAYDAAKSDFNGGRYLPAARAFEVLWETYRLPKYLHYAALAWATAGEDARAILYWRRLGTLTDATPKELEEAERYLEGARGRTTAVTLAVTPVAAVAEARLSFVRQGSEAGPIEVRAADLIDPSSGLRRIDLEAGSWTVIVLPDADRYVEARTSVRADAATTAQELSLELHPVLSALNLTIAPAESLRAGVTLRLNDNEGRVAERILQVTGEQLTVPLPVGTWSLRAESPGSPPIEETLAVRRDQPTLFAVVFRPPTPTKPDKPPESPPELETVRYPRLAVGLMIGAAASAVAGAALVGIGEAQIADSARNNGLPAEDCVMKESGGLYRVCLLDTALDLAGNGGVFLGASLGLATTALMARAKIRPQRWYAPLVIGVASAIGGATWYGATFKERYDLLRVQAFLEPSALRGPRIDLYPSTILIGAGAGLIVGSVAALVARRRGRRGRATVQSGASPRGGGVLVHF